MGQMKPLGWLVERLLSVLVPMSVARQQQFFTSSWLADVEADHDSWAPDELWAAQRRHPAGKASPSGGTPRTGGSTDPTPPGVGAPADAASSLGGVGRHSKPEPAKSDEEAIEELVADYEAFIRDCFERRNRN